MYIIVLAPKLLITINAEYFKRKCIPELIETKKKFLFFSFLLFFNQGTTQANASWDLEYFFERKKKIIFDVRSNVRSRRRWESTSIAVQIISMYTALTEQQLLLLVRYQFKYNKSRLMWSLWARPKVKTLTEW